MTWSQPSIALFSSPTSEQIAAAVATAFDAPPIPVLGLMQAVSDAFQTPPPPITMDELATAVVFALNQRPITPGDVAVALHRFDARATMPAVSAALIASFPEMDANVLATTLASASVFNLGSSDVAPLLGALAPLPRIDAARAALAVRPALSLPITDATLLARPLAQQFGLTRMPNDVSALGVAFFRAGYALDVTAVAFAALFAPWNGFAFGRLESVYTGTEWEIAIQLQSDGKSVIEAAPQIRDQFPQLSSSDMALVLASVFDLTVAAAGVTPVAEAMKAATYALDETALGMSQFFTPWTAEYFGQVLQVYE